MLALVCGALGYSGRPRRSAPTPAPTLSSQVAAPAVVTSVTQGAASPTPVGVSGTVLQRANVRDGPSTAGTHVLETVDVGTLLKLRAVTQDGNWYAVTLPQGRDGWVYGRLLRVDQGAASGLLVLPPPAPSAVAVLVTAVSPVATLASAASIPTIAPTTLPAPTATPVVPAGSVSTDPLARARYIMAALDAAGAYSGALQRVGEQTNRAVRRPTLLRDPAWRSTTSMALKDLNAAAAHVGQLQPAPPQLQNLDSALRRVAGQTPTFTADYARTIQTQSPVDLATTLRDWQRLGNAIQAVGGELQRMR